ncbi:MAG: AsmA-like C-terminal region-containing protein [Gemmataceae bacterium]
MPWRVWVVRGVVFSVLGLVGAGAVLYVLYTDPARVRLIVQEKLGVKFDRVAVQLGSARFRLLGGVLVSELRLARSDGLDSSDFLYVPSAVLFHDKEHLLDGKFQVRRVELDRPQLRLVRLRDGRLNLSGLTTASDPGDRLPTMIIRGGTLVLEDQQLAPGVTLLEISKVQLTALNDPLPVVQIEATGQVDVLGPIRIKATFDRRTQAINAQIVLGQIPIESALIHRLGVIVPEASKHLARLKGKGQIEASVQYTPGKVNYVAQARMHDGQWIHPLLHVPLEAISCRATLRDGHLPEAHLRGRLDGAAVEVSLRDLTLPQSRYDLDHPTNLLSELNAHVDHLPVTHAALKALPSSLKFLADEYNPSGPLSLQYHFQRQPNGVPRQVWIARPQGMSGSYHEFRYEVRDIRGEIRVDTTHLPRNDISVDLTGTAGTSPVEVKGHFHGSPQTPEMELTVRGQDLLLDHHLIGAMPTVVQGIIGQFLPSDSRQWGLERCPMGQADFEAHFVRHSYSREIEKTIRVHFKKTRVRYDQFPYPLEDVSGTLLLYPDHWEARGFHGRYDGGEIGVEGRSYRLPDRAVAGADGTRREEVRVTVTGKNIQLGKTFEEALVPDAASVKGGAPERKAMQAAWRRLQLSGRLNFRAIIRNHPDHTPDVDFWIELLRCRMKPQFFAYAMEDVSGSVRYHQGNIILDQFTARHGLSPLRLEWGLIQPRGDGQVSAWLDQIRASKLVIDDDLLRALPEGLAQACRTLKIGPTIDLNQLDLRLVSTEPGAAPKIWWDAGVHLDQAHLRTGIDLSQVSGRFHTKGHFDGRALHGFQGQLALSEARAFGQPLRDITARIDIPVQAPHKVQIADLKGKLFGGTLGGEAHLVLGPRPQYKVLLDSVGVDLGEVGKQHFGSSSSLAGKVRAVVLLHGEGDELQNLRGSGRVDIAHGKMGQLPVLLDLLKAFGLRKPDGTAFEQAHAAFTLAGPRVHVSVLELYGSAISLRGEGGLDIDGNNIELDFAATLGRMDEWMPGLGGLPRVLSSQLLKLKMRGGVGPGQKVRFDKELVPGIWEPLRRAGQSVTGGAAW